MYNTIVFVWKTLGWHRALYNLSAVDEERLSTPEEEVAVDTTRIIRPSFTGRWWEEGVAREAGTGTTSFFLSDSQEECLNTDLAGCCAWMYQFTKEYQWCTHTPCPHGRDSVVLLYSSRRTSCSSTQIGSNDCGVCSLHLHYGWNTIITRFAVVRDAAWSSSPSSILC